MPQPYSAHLVPSSSEPQAGPPPSHYQRAKETPPRHPTSLPSPYSNPLRRLAFFLAEAFDSRRISMRAFLETQLPGGSAHHLQAALYTQGLLYHDSKTRRNGVAPLARPEELLEELAVECRRNRCTLCLTKSHSLKRSRLPPAHSPHHLSTRLATSPRCSAYPNSFTTSPLVSPRLATSPLVSPLSTHITNSPPVSPPFLSSHHLSSRVATSPFISSPLDSSHRPFTRLTTSPLISPPLHLFHHLSTRLTTPRPPYPCLHYLRSHPRTSSRQPSISISSPSSHPLPPYPRFRSM